MTEINLDITGITGEISGSMSLGDSEATGAVTAGMVSVGNAMGYITTLLGILAFL
jgi:hypothetical protein